MSYKFLEHTSDIVIQAEGKSFEDALQEVAKGMITQMGSKKARKKEKMAFEIRQKETREDDVVAVLTEIVATCESEPFTPAAIKIKKTSSGFFVEMSGERKQPENIIKAVTYHGLKIEQNTEEREDKEGKERWRITVLFDI